MSLRDRDLVSIQEARDLVSRAATAQRKYAAFSQEQVDAIVEVCAHAAAENAEALARAAVEETGFGNVPDKIIKNTLAAVDVPRAIRSMRTVGILREDRERGIVEVASPVGVVAAVIPATNPTSTAIYKTLISLKAQNAIVLSPHPAAMRCICLTAGILERAALAAGAPEGLINCMQTSTLDGTRELMRRPETGVILATGGSGLVRAAYSSGKPAYGVGPGNVPALIERTADVHKAVADIFVGKTFDYGTICSSEQALVAEASIAQTALEECRRQGAYFLSPEEIAKVGRLVIVPGTAAPNPKIVGRAATVIAEMAGMQVPDATRVLIARLEPHQVGREFPLSAEKLSPVLAFYVVNDFAGGIDLCRRLLEFGGLGHTCSIHSQNRSAIVEFGKAMPAFRVIVNTASVHGSIGYSTKLFPAMTLGCGAPGGNITSDNIGPQHLFNIKRIAWESRVVEHRTMLADQRMAGGSRLPKSVTAGSTGGAVVNSNPVSDSAAQNKMKENPRMTYEKKTENVAIDRAAIAQVVEQVMAAHGIARGGAKVAPASSTPAEKELEPPSRIAGEIAGRLFGEATSPPAPAAPVIRQEIPVPRMAPPKPEAPAAPPVTMFVSENDVRRAMTRSEKIYIGRKTILTPSARDLGVEHEVFVETEAGALR